MDKIKEATKKWIREKTESPRAEQFLAAISFSESVFFPIPPDFFLIPMTLAKKDKWFRFALITTIFSILGAIAGYLLGAFFFDAIVQPIIDFYSLGEEMAIVASYFAKGTFLVVFASALTPIPYKVFTLTAGVLGAPFIPFLLASILGRGIRFFAEGILLNKYGEKIAETVYSLINKYSVLAVLILVLIFLVYLSFR